MPPSMQTALPFIDLSPSPDPEFVLRVVKVPVRPVAGGPLRLLSVQDRAFWTAIEANPDLYTSFVRLARDLQSRGHRKIGAKMLMEVLRWQSMLRTIDGSCFKINNNWTSRLARLAMTNEPDLAGMFDVRELRS